MISRQLDIVYTLDKRETTGLFPFEYTCRGLKYTDEDVLATVTDITQTVWTTSREAAQRLVNSWDAIGRSPLTIHRRNQYHYSLVEPSEEYKQAETIVKEWGNGDQSELVRAISDAILKAKGK